MTEVEEKLLSMYKEYKNYSNHNLPSEVHVEFVYLQKVYDRMIFLFSSILNEIQNGDLYLEYQKLVKQSNHGDSFIIFNWDTLLDRVLYETGDWFIEDGYHVPFKAVFRDGWERIEVQHIEKKSKFNLFKLHGSTNWLIPYYSFDFSKGKWDFLNNRADFIRRPIYAFHYATKKYQTYDDRFRVGYEPFSYFYYPPDVPIGIPNDPEGKVRISFGLYPDVRNYGFTNKNNMIQASMPLIVPPVKNKNYSFLEGVLEDLWKKSKKALVESDEIIIIGYSFPATDTKAWELLNEVVNMRKNDIPQIKIIDPYPAGLVKRIIENYPQLQNKIEVNEMTIKEYFS